MKVSEIFKVIEDNLKKVPDYDNTKKQIYKAEKVKDRYAIATNEYWPGRSTVSMEDNNKMRLSIVPQINRTVYYMENMKALLTDGDKRAAYRHCENIFKKNVDMLKEYLLKYEGFNRVDLAHTFFVHLEIPYASFKEYDADGFLGKLMEIQIKKVNNIRKQHIQEGLRECYYGAINKLSSEVFTEDEILPAAIILSAYEENNMKGMKNARYFVTIVSNELEEIVDDKKIAEIVKKLIENDHINGEIDGQYHFLLRD